MIAPPSSSAARALATRYGVPSKRQITHIDPGGFQWIETYDRKHRLLSRKDPLGNDNQTTYDEASEAGGPV